MAGLFRALAWIAVSAIGAISAVSAGCSAHDYAVVLWSSADSELDNGAIVRVRGGGGTDDTGKITVTTTDGERYRVNEWQVEQFRSQDEMDAFMVDYLPYQHVFAQCDKKALPLRQDADRFSDILYRFEEGEIMKVTGRGADISDEAGLRDYWYRTLTSSGERGWVFGYYLSISDGAP